VWPPTRPQALPLQRWGGWPPLPQFCLWMARSRMTKVMAALCQDRQVEDEDEERVNLFDVGQPNDARDECLLLERGSGYPLGRIPVVTHLPGVCAAGAHAAAPHRGRPGRGARAAAAAQ
jgi:hypothetical protein